MSIVALDRKSILFAGKTFQRLHWWPDLGHCLSEVNWLNLATHFIDVHNLSGRKLLLSIMKQEKWFWGRVLAIEAVRRCLDPWHVSKKNIL